MDEVEVALHHTVLTWLSVDGDVSVIEVSALAILEERKVVLIYFGCLAVVKCHMPVGAFHIDEVDIIALFVEERVQTLT